ncbi:MAG: hypothetical protein ACI4QJ_08270 [Candidatus Spyradenecus sp.]
MRLVALFIGWVFVYTNLIAGERYPSQLFFLETDDTDEHLQVIDRYGAVHSPRGRYLTPPQFWEGRPAGIAVREDRAVVFLREDGEELLELPEAYKNKQVGDFLSNAVSEGYFVDYPTGYIPGLKWEEKAFCFVDHRGVRSKVYVAKNSFHLPRSFFQNGLAVVQREGNWYLLDGDYQEQWLCTQAEGEPWPFFCDQYSVLYLTQPTVPGGTWPWPYDTVAIINRQGERIAQFPNVAHAPMGCLARGVSAQGCLVPVLEQGALRYRYYLFATRQFVEGFSCTAVHLRGFSEGVAIVKQGETLVLLKESGQWRALPNDYLDCTEEDCGTLGVCHQGLLCLRRKDGRLCWVTPEGSVQRLLPERAERCTPYGKSPFWQVSLLEGERYFGLWLVDCDFNYLHCFGFPSLREPCEIDLKTMTVIPEVSQEPTPISPQ